MLLGLPYVFLYGNRNTAVMRTHVFSAEPAADDFHVSVFLRAGFRAELPDADLKRLSAAEAAVLDLPCALVMRCSVPVSRLPDRKRADMPYVCLSDSAFGAAEHSRYLHIWDAFVD